jgi:ubiquinone/menaquinone biosynthesis C-methylase UbiE
MADFDRYILDYKHEEQERLQRQAQQLAHESSWLFAQIGVPVGARVVEIGCGPHGCLDLLAERVGPSGSVVGVESNQDAVDLARKLMNERRLTNVEVLCRDARATALPRAAFDLATARLVLITAPEPQQIIAEAVALLRPGGWIALHETDYMTYVCDPPSEAAERIFQLLVTYLQKNGIDPFIGRKLPRLLREAGLEDVHVRPFIHVYPPGYGRRSLLLDFAENLSERILAQKLIEEREFTDLKRALRRHLDDPETLVVSNLYFQSWGRKPASWDKAQQGSGADTQ